MEHKLTYQDALICMEKGKWEKLNTASRLDALQAVENEIAARQGREACPVNGEAMHSGAHSTILGYYDRSTNRIYINELELVDGSTYGHDPQVHLDTVLHEGRHAYQAQAVAGVITHNNQKELVLWRENLKEGNYISYKENPKAYYYQPVEVDARKFSQSMQHSIIAEQGSALNDQKHQLAEENIRNLLSDNINKPQDYDTARETTRSIMNSQKTDSEKAFTSKDHDLDREQDR